MSHSNYLKTNSVEGVREKGERGAKGGYRNSLKHPSLPLHSTVNWSSMGQVDTEECDLINMLVLYGRAEDPSS